MFKNLITKIVSFGVKKFVIISIVVTIVAATAIVVGICLANNLNKNDSNIGTVRDEDSFSISEENSNLEIIEDEINSKIQNSQENVSSNKQNTVVTSKPTTNTNNASSKTQNTTTSSKPSTTNANTSSQVTSTKPEPTYKTIKLYEKTTYYGFTGYFTTDQNHLNVDLIKYGIKDTNNNVALYVTEYRDVDSNNVVWFACDGNDCLYSDLMDYVDEVGRAQVLVKTAN